MYCHLASSLDDHPLDVRDFLLLELLKWFKNRFFKWTDSPRCDVCGGQTRSIGMVEPTAEERRWEAGRVEGYACTQCNRNVRFPRYDHKPVTIDKKLVGEQFNAQGVFPSWLIGEE